jgi:hypothetical protein
MGFVVVPEKGIAVQYTFCSEARSNAVVSTPRDMLFALRLANLAPLSRSV